MKIAYLIIVVLHGLIHLIGPAKAMGWAENSPLNAAISKPMGLLWLAAALCTLTYGLLFGWKVSAAWMLGLVAVILSQALIYMYWSDARFGTIINAIMLIVILFSYGEWQFERQSAREQADILDQVITIEPAERVSVADTVGLPVPVQNWLQQSGALDRPRIRYGYIDQRVFLKTQPDQEKFYPAVARQLTRLDEPAFLWTVDVDMNPVMWMRGRDRYAEGHGEMKIWLNSLIPVVQEEGPKIDEGSMQRFLGEMVWFPHLALSPHIEWEAIDDRQARAHMKYGGIEASGLFQFRTNGDLDRFEALRYYGGDPDGGRKLWVLTVQDYARFEGIRVPSLMEASWQLDSGNWTWLKLEVEDIRYE